MNTTAQANSAIKVSALIVGGVYLYRRFTEGTASELKASETVTPLGRFLVGWGVVFFSLSALAGPFPGVAGELAILLVLGTLLTNGVQISKDLNKGLRQGKSSYQKGIEEGRLDGPPAPTPGTSTPNLTRPKVSAA